MPKYKVWDAGCAEEIEADSAQEAAEEFAAGGDWGDAGARLDISAQELTECDYCAELAIVKIGDEHLCLAHVTMADNASAPDPDAICEWCDKPAIALVAGQEHACADHLIDCAGAGEPEDGSIEYCEVNIEPDHSAMIRAEVGRGAAICGYDPDDHDWIRPVELVGGLNENPGVWSHGGTAMSFSWICSRCGLRKTENITGSQHNPGECDTTSYSAPEDDDIQRLKDIGEYTGEEDEMDDREVEAIPALKSFAAEEETNA